MAKKIKVYMLSGLEARYEPLKDDRRVGKFLIRDRRWTSPFRKFYNRFVPPANHRRLPFKRARQSAVVFHTAQALQSIDWSNIGNVLKGTYKRFLRPLGKPRTIRIKKHTIIIGVLLLALYPSPHRVVYADPIIPKIINPPLQIQLAQITTQPQARLEAVVPPAPVIVTGCGSDPNLAFIYQHESGCCPTKWQGQGYCPSTFASIYAGDETDTYRGYGLCQSTPAIKMASVGADWQTNWNTQNTWCTNYAITRYGSTYAAYLHWIANRNW